MTKEGLDLIKEFESFQGQAYLDPTGVPTIGYGTTMIGGYSVQLGMEINKPVAELLLQIDLSSTEKEVRHLVRAELTHSQIDALVSFHYNTGGLGTSSLLKHINSHLPVIEDFFTRWNKAHVNGVLVELPGLTRRRKAEFALYDGKRV